MTPNNGNSGGCCGFIANFACYAKQRRSFFSETNKRRRTLLPEDGPWKPGRDTWTGTAVEVNFIHTLLTIIGINCRNLANGERPFQS